LLGEHSRQHAYYYHISTENINTLSTRELLGKIAIGPGFVAKPAHLNVHVRLPAVTDGQRLKLQWLMGQFDSYRAACDDNYPFEYFFNAFISWTGYQIRRSKQVESDNFRTYQELRDSLKIAADFLNKGDLLVRQLSDSLQQAAESLLAEAEETEAKDPSSLNNCSRTGLCPEGSQTKG
jgi:hypothetical protein